MYVFLLNNNIEIDKQIFKYFISLFETKIVLKRENIYNILSYTYSLTFTHTNAHNLPVYNLNKKDLELFYIVKRMFLNVTWFNNNFKKGEYC